jgi:hypothetical protein
MSTPAAERTAPVAGSRRSSCDAVPGGCVRSLDVNATTLPRGVATAGPLAAPVSGLGGDHGGSAAATEAVRRRAVADSAAAIDRRLRCMYPRRIRAADAAAPGCAPWIVAADARRAQPRSEARAPHDTSAPGRANRMP